MVASLDPTICEQARLSRDRRFDGRFFVAVVTTGVYCRPVCPVPPPKPENVRFYPSAAAAEAAGFRPCLRCRPETAPGSAAWQGVDVSVQRALRLIAEGALDGAPLTALAARLGIGERYLRKLFERHVGASPLAVAQTRRLQLAKQLLDDSGLAMTAVAAAAGYGSLRRFNAAFERCYGRPPSQLRRSHSTGLGLRLLLRYRPPLHWQQFVDHLQLRLIPEIERLNEQGYCRSYRHAGGHGWLRLRPLTNEDALELTLDCAATIAIGPLVARLRRQFDLDSEPQLISDWLARDPLLQPLLQRWPGLRLPAAFDPFEQAVRTVIGQQVSVKAAITLCRRLVQRLGQPLPQAAAEQPGWLFPTPEAIAEGNLDGLGLTNKRVETLRQLAAAVASGALPLNAEQGSERLHQALCQLPGIGDWSASYLALRGCAEPDELPVGDLGLRKAAIWGPEGISARALAEHGQRWRPWRSYAAVYLWQSYSHGPLSDGEPC